MIKEDVKNELERLSRKLIKFLNDNPDSFHPHHKIIIDNGSFELVEGVIRIPIDDYIID